MLFHSGAGSTATLVAPRCEVISSTCGNALARMYDTHSDTGSGQSDNAIKRAVTSPMAGMPKAWLSYTPE